MSSDKSDEHQGATKHAGKGNEPQEPRARGRPGSFDQPVPRDEFMPRQGGRPTCQTAEVPLGTGDVPEPPGGGGLPARRAPAFEGMRTECPLPQPGRGATLEHRHRP